VPELEMSAPFRRLLSDLPEDLRRRIREKLRLLAENPGHPSLRVKRMPGHRGIWEMSVSMDHRVTFEYAGNTIRLRRVGSHDILQNP
jgi:mRNA interferase RelE/StbE